MEKPAVPNALNLSHKDNSVSTARSTNGGEQGESTIVLSTDGLQVA